MAKKKSLNVDARNDQTNASESDIPSESPALTTAAKPLKRRLYREELAKLQVELFRLQEWVQAQNLRLVILLEGLGPAGKKGTGNRITEGLDRRVCQLITLDMPKKRERGQWHFQRYVQHFPSAGKIVILDGSWYHLPSVERALGLITDQEYQDFLRSCADFEQMLMRSGVSLVKYWFSANDEEQEGRFRGHVADLAKHKKGDVPEGKPVADPVECAVVRDEVFALTEADGAAWYLVNADDKRRARLNCIRHLLDLVPAPGATVQEASAGHEQEGEASADTSAPEAHPRAVPEVY